MVRVRWTVNNGERILYVDLSNISDEDEILQTINIVIKNIENKPWKSVPILVNAYRAKLDLELDNNLIDDLLQYEKYIKAIAIIGLYGFKRRMVAKYIKSYNRNDIRIFKEPQEAEDWLVNG